MTLKIPAEKLNAIRPPRHYNNLQITDLDPLSAGSTTYPRLIEVRKPDSDGALVYAEWHGWPAGLQVNDYVRCRQDGTDTEILIVEGWGASSSHTDTTDAQVLTLATHAGLSAERVFTPGDSLTGTDGGAGSTYTLDVDAASTTAAGSVEIATQAEVDTGTDTTRSITPETLAGVPVDHLRVSLLRDSDDGADSVTVDASGNVTIAQSGAALLGTGSNEPDIGSTTASQQFGNIYVASGKDVYPSGDTGGVQVRTVDFWSTPVIHFTNFTGFTWASYGGLATPNTVDTSTYPDLVMIYQNGGTSRGFAYYSSFATTIRCRVAVGPDVYAGLRMDDGSNNNYFEWFTNATATQVDFITRYAIGGSVTGPTTVKTAYSKQFFDLFLNYNSSLGGFLVYDTVNAPLPAFISFTSLAITPTQSGIMVQNHTNPGSLGRAAAFDRYGS